MSIFGNSKGHFLADISIFPCGPEANRRNEPAFNGIRWAFVYAEDFDQDPSNASQSDVWPEFLDASGLAVASGVPLVGMYQAKMHIIFDHMIHEHFKRLCIGTEFYCAEGLMKTAEGVVTKLSV